MTSIDARSVLKRGADVRYRLIDGEAVVVRQRAAEVLVLNDVAARILALADGAAPVSAWLAALAAEYEADRSAPERVVLGFAAELAAEGILEPVP